MKFVNPIFKTKKIKLFLADLIHDYQCDHYSKLSYSDKCELVALILEALGNGNNHEFFVESNDLDCTITLFKKSLNGTFQDNENFLDAIKEQAVKYYEETMTTLFSYALDDYEKSVHEWKDYIGKYGDSDQAYDAYKEQLTW